MIRSWSQDEEEKKGNLKDRLTKMKSKRRSLGIEFNETA